MSEIRCYAVIEIMDCYEGRAVNILALRSREEDADRIRKALADTSDNFDKYQVTEYIIP